MKDIPSRITQPLGVRIFHWALAFVIIVLILTGLYRAHPGWLEINLRTVRMIHAPAGFILLAVVVGYLLYHLKGGTISHIIFSYQDLKRLPRFLKYVIFLAPEYQRETKYNPGQKLIFTSWLVFLLIQLITGFMLYTKKLIFYVSLEFIMYVHYLATFGFVTILFHIYFALTEDPSGLQAIFTGREKE